MIYSILLLFVYCFTSESMHFNGGTIDWKPMDADSNETIVPIAITQSYSWTYPNTSCAHDVPITTPGRSNQNAFLACVADCGTDGGYSTNPVDILTDCQTSSLSLGLMTSQRTVYRNISADAHFTVSFTGRAWIDLNFPAQKNLPWSLAATIDLRRRPDGIINTPPVASVISPQYAIVNQQTQITIPVSDANNGDEVRCRWAVYTAPMTRRKRSKVARSTDEPIDECGGICYPGSMPVGTTLSSSNCTISFKGTVANTWYAVAIQVEDFMNGTNQTAMSSIPVQFLIYVMGNQTCGSRPVINPLDRCRNVQVGVPISFNISARTTCNSNVSDIDTITIASGINGMNMSSTIHSETDPSTSYTTFTWTPRADQIGSNQLCTIAYSQEKLQSDQYCITFDVTESEPICEITTLSTTTTRTTTSTTRTTTSTTSTTTTRTTTSTSSATTTTRTTTSTTSATTTTRTTTSTSSATTTTTTSTTSATTTTATTTTTTTTSTSTATTATTTSTTSATTTTRTTTSTSSATTTTRTTTSTSSSTTTTRTTTTTTTTRTTTTTATGSTTTFGSTTSTVSSTPITSATTSTVSTRTSKSRRTTTSRITSESTASTSTVPGATVIIIPGQTTIAGMQISGTSLIIIIVLSLLAAVFLCGFCCCGFLQWNSIRQYYRPTNRVENLQEVCVEEPPQEVPPQVTPVMNYVPPPPMIRRTQFMLALVRPPPLPTYVPKNNIRSSKVVQAVSGPTIAKPGNVVVVSGRR